MSKQRTQSPTEKALDINLDPLFYGTFAEIGAGQEVARHFFQAGKASQTVALTISAYDMVYSDIIYGREKNGRYVCQSRVTKMLDREYRKLIERLGPVRGDQTCFFSFADTVATGSDSQKKQSHGWMGVQFQTNPNGEMNEVVLHVRLLDKHRLQQQEALSILGVNLLHSSFYKRKSETEFITGLFENIKLGSLAVDAIHFSGKGFQNFSDVSVNISLVDLGWSEACMINENGLVQNPSDYLWDKSVLLQRGFFHPVTNTYLDIFSRGLQHFKNEFQLKNSDVVGLFEFTIDNRIKGTKVNHQDACFRVQMITTLKIPVLVTRFTYFYQLKEFVRLSTTKPLGIVVGAIHLDKLFDESFYFDLSGGLLEGMGKLLGRFSRLYIYPHKREDICLLTKSFFPKPGVKHIYSHFIENKMIQDIANCEELEESMRSEEVAKLIKSKDKKWKKMVPEAIHKLIEKH